MRLPGRRGGRETAGRLRSAAALLLAAAALEACVAFAPPQCPAPPQAQGQGARPRTAPLGRLSRRSAPAFSPARETVQLRRPSPCSRPGGAAGRLYSQLRLYSPGPAGGEGGGAAPEPAEPRRHAVRVRALPPWLTPVKRLLGPGEWRVRPATDGTLEAAAMLTRTEACLLAARTRGLGFGGRRLELEAKPTLPRNAVRAARTEEVSRAHAPARTPRALVRPTLTIIKSPAGSQSAGILARLHKEGRQARRGGQVLAHAPATGRAARKPCAASRFSGTLHARIRTRGREGGKEGRTHTHARARTRARMPHVRTLFTHARARVHAHNLYLMRQVDATCGAGGNAIAFARAGCSVRKLESRATHARTRTHTNTHHHRC